MSTVSRIRKDADKALNDMVTAVGPENTVTWLEGNLIAALLTLGVGADDAGKYFAKVSENYGAVMARRFVAAAGKSRNI